MLVLRKAVGQIRKWALQWGVEFLFSQLGLTRLRMALLVAFKHLMEMKKSL